MPAGTGQSEPDVTQIRELEERLDNFRIQTSDDLTISGSAWNGYAFNCPSCPEPEVSSVITGGCCIDDVCSITTESACTEAGGTYLGNGTPCAPDLCGCTFTVQFNGVTFGCACLALATEAHYEFYEGGVGGTPINGTIFPVIVNSTSECPSCVNSPAGTLNFRFYFLEGCVDEFEEGGSDYAIYVALISGIYYIMVADLGNSIIFFYGTTTDASVPASNEVTITSSPTTWSNPLFTCIGLASVELCGVGTGGTGTFL